MRLLVTCNSDSASYHFRSDYFKALQAVDLEYEVVSIMNLGMSKEISDITSNRHHYLNLKVCYQILFNRNSFTHFHGFTHLGNLLVLLCFWRLDKIVFTITGQGKLFMYRRYFPYKTLLIAFYRIFRNKAVFIVQNSDDYVFYKTTIGAKDVMKTAGSGVKIDLNNKRLPTDSDKIRIGFASRPNLDKGYRNFLDAVERFHGRYKFVRAGDISADKTLFRRQEKCVKKEWLEDLGRLKDMNTFFESVDIVVLLGNYREGVPRLLLESMNREKLVIALDTFGVRDHVNHTNGYLLGSAKSFFDLLEAGAFDFSKSERGRSYAIKYFNVDKVIDVYFEALNC